MFDIFFKDNLLVQQLIWRWRDSVHLFTTRNAAICTSVQPSYQVPRGLKNPFGRRVSSRGGEKETLRLGTAGLQPQARAQGGVAPLLRNGKIWLKPVTTLRIGWICIWCTTKIKNNLFFFVTDDIYGLFHINSITIERNWLIKGFLLFSRWWICC